MNTVFVVNNWDWVNPTWMQLNDLPDPQMCNGQIVPTLGEYVEPYPQVSFTEITTIGIG